MQLSGKNIYFLKCTLVFCLLFFLIGCDNYFKDDYKDNSPTSGQLNVYYDEGLYLHVKNQAYTFHSQYTRAKINLIQSNDDKAIEALYNDSCEAIIISRQLNKKETEAFASKNYFPKYSILAYSGLALIANKSSSVKSVSKGDIISLLSGKGECKDSMGIILPVKILLDKNNSSVAHYVFDSILNGHKISENVSVLKSSLEAFNYVSENKNTIACVDFAWLSDVDDSITKYYANKIKILGVDLGNGKVSYPSQSSFKLNSYPFIRKIYCYRKTGDFSLAKGFETFIAGPKGQMIFLKQGLLPFKQQERMIEVKFESLQN